MEKWTGSRNKPVGDSSTSYHSIKIAEYDVVFDNRLLHGTFPNDSPPMRLELHVRMVPHSTASKGAFSAENVPKRHDKWARFFESYGLNYRATNSNSGS
jgi:hypothetical protein